MNNSAQYSGVGLFFILGIVITYLVYSSLSDFTSGRSAGYEIEASFDDLLQLRNGDDVRMSGVKIGTVISTNLIDGRAVAMLNIDRKYEIPADSKASIAMAGLLGTNFIAIEMGKDRSDFIKPGGDIRTMESFDINKIFSEVGDVANMVSGALSELTGIFGSDEDGKGNVFTELSGLIQENRSRIGNSLDNIEHITAQLASGDGTIGKLLFEDGAYNEIMATVKEIQGAASQADTMLTSVQGIVDHVKSGQGSLGELLYGDQIASELQTTITNIRDFTEKLNNPDSTIGRLLTDDQIYFEVQSVVRKANRTLDSIGDAAPISAVGVAIAPLF